MDSNTFWKLIADARASVPDPSDSEAVATAASTLLAARPPAEIVAAQQVLWDLLAESYQNPLWAAAYLINGGCSDDGFDYFRGWLLTQGQEVYDSVLASPDSLASLPIVIAAAESEVELECEEALSIAWNAHLKATGSPADALARTASSVFAVLQATLDSGERELRLIAAQDAIASPACEFAVAQVR